METLDNFIVQLSKEDDILSPRYDGTFKSIFTRETPEAKVALIDFLSTFIDKKVTEVRLMPNEPAIENERDKALRFDIQCKFDDGEKGVNMAVQTLLTISQDEIARHKTFQKEKRMQDAISDRIDAIRSGEARGIAIGETNGRKEMAVEMAKNLLSRNIDLDIISETTGLTISEIEKLRH